MRKIYAAAIAVFFLLTACRSSKTKPMINWVDLEDKLVAAGEVVLRDASQRYANEKFYGLVIEIPQNWGFELYLNTEAGLADGISNFRKDSVGYEAKTDAEVESMLGRWYFQSWKFRYLSMQLDPVLLRLNDANYELLKDACEQGDGDEIEAGFKECVARAATRIIRGDAVAALPKATDFSAKVADEDGFDLFSKERIK